MLFPRSFGSFLFPLLATMHAAEGAGETPSKLDPDESGKSQGSLTKRESGGVNPSRKGGNAGRRRRAVRSPDERLALVARSYGRAMCELAGVPDPEGHAILQAALGEADDFTKEAGDGRGKEKDTGPRQGGRQAMGGGGGKGAGAGSDLMAMMERTRYRAALGLLYMSPIFGQSGGGYENGRVCEGR